MVGGLNLARGVGEYRPLDQLMGRPPDARCSTVVIIYIIIRPVLSSSAETTSTTPRARRRSSNASRRKATRRYRITIPVDDPARATTTELLQQSAHDTRVAGKTVYLSYRRAQRHTIATGPSGTTGH